MSIEKTKLNTDLQKQTSYFWKIWRCA